VSFIARQQDLSVAYLEQLLHRLKKHGLVLSARGPKGGYRLAKEPELITLAEVVRVLDGSPEAQDGWTKDGHQHARRTAHAVFQCVHERLANSLDEVTLKDVVNQVRELSGDAWEHRYVFHI